MTIFQLMRGRFMNLKFGIFPCVMLLFATVRTLLSGDAIMLTGLCMAFLPFFSQQKNTTCFAIDVSEEKEIFSTYLMDYILMFVGLVYLYGLTVIGRNFIPGYVENPLLLETFLLVLLCNLVFINILVPLTYALDGIQRLMVGAVLAIAEVAFMNFAMFALKTMGDAFVLTAQPWLYALLVMIPLNTILFTVIRWKQKKTLTSEPSDEKETQEKLLEIAMDAHTGK